MSHSYVKKSKSKSRELYDMRVSKLCLGELFIVNHMWWKKQLHGQKRRRFYPMLTEHFMILTDCPEIMPINMSSENSLLFLGKGFD